MLFTGFVGEFLFFLQPFLHFSYVLHLLISLDYLSSLQLQTNLPIYTSYNIPYTLSFSFIKIPTIYTYISLLSSIHEVSIISSCSSTHLVFVDGRRIPLFTCISYIFFLFFNVLAAAPDISLPLFYSVTYPIINNNFFLDVFYY